MHPRAVRRGRDGGHARDGGGADDEGHASYDERVAAGVRAFLETLAEYPDSAQTLLVEIIGAGPRAAARRDAILEAFADALYRDNRAPRRATAPTFASADDAFAIIGAASSSSRASCAPAARRTARARAGDHAAHARRAPARVTRPGLAALEARDRRAAGAARGWSRGASRWRARSARRSPSEEYWGRPVPGFGDPDARVLVLGLAPAAHGGNRTGRVFTGDRSGDWLFAALHRAGFANQPTSVHRDDGLRLHDAWIAAAVRCAPPANKPTPEERDTCLPWTVAELEQLADLRVVVCLGAFAWDAALRLRAALGHRGRGRGRASATTRSSTPAPAAAARLLSPQPAEHVHRRAHRADARRGVRARARAGRG